MSDSLVERLKEWADEERGVWDIESIPLAALLVEAASALESLQAENERLKRLIVEHNRELCGMCDKRDCGFKAYNRRCPECPREYVIAAHQASASSGEPEETAAARVARMETALRRIARWHELPATGRFWDEPDNTRPMSYSAAFGSNGERDYMRQIALDALRDTAPVGSQGGDDSGCGHDHGVER